MQAALRATAIASSGWMNFMGFVRLRLLGSVGDRDYSEFQPENSNRRCDSRGQVPFCPGRSFRQAGSYSSSMAGSVFRPARSRCSFKSSGVRPFGKLRASG